MNKYSIRNAFKELNLITESEQKEEIKGIEIPNLKVESKAFDIADQDDLGELSKYLDEKDEAEEVIEPIVDEEAGKEEDLKDSYVGKIVIECNVCKNKFYKEEEDIVKSEEDENIVNLEDECPICNSLEGYTIVGKIAPYEEEEKVEEESKEEVEEAKSEEPKEESEEESEEKSEESEEESKEEVEEKSEESEEEKTEEPKELKEEKQIKDYEINVFVFIGEMRYKDYVIEFFINKQDGKYYWQAEYDGEDRSLSNFNIWVTARGISLYSEDDEGYPTKEDAVAKAKEWINDQKRR